MCDISTQNQFHFLFTSHSPLDYTQTRRITTLLLMYILPVFYRKNHKRDSYSLIIIIIDTTYRSTDQDERYGSSSSFFLYFQMVSSPNIILLPFVYSTNYVIHTRHLVTKPNDHKNGKLSPFTRS